MKPDYSTLTLLLFAAGTVGLNAHTTTHSGTNHDFNPWFSLLEIPFLIAVAGLSFIVVSALRGGELGKGISLMARGFLIMAIRHIHMQVELRPGLLHYSPPGPYSGLGFITPTKPAVYKL
ncbi:MAG: hypothetical protein RLP14_08685 [Owenweeksia sp.]